ncbi:Na+/H+ antiporter NhaC [Planomicrobium sp. YIM 101495]|uniref:Na+/H+ antiporter NhaC n=1 Tax=Planomicrobium sp. YIM 101495 TaxID=2665160 RepID=UPI0012B7E2A4|nr:Na+/H+ antiporter NhaC [Planomicrobium sp. YIM 101495]MTD29864.1 Na+/H+ antiporter NhaC [Planomicrobium sp. YIM 101495]
MKQKEPTFTYALLAFLFIFAFLVTGILVIGASLQLMMFLGWLLVIPIAMKIGFTYQEVEGFAFDMIRGVLGVIMILLAVGALIGTWAAAGTISTMTSIGLDLISPQFFLVVALLLCSAVSLATGTSWGTLGSVGIALIGVAAAFEINLAIAAGAIVCGSVFGDKLSPFSDSTNMAAAVSRVDLMDHVKHMLWTTVPALTGTAIIFLAIGLYQEAGSSLAAVGQINEIKEGVGAELALGWVTLLPMVVIFVLLMLQKPAFPSIFLGAAAGFLISMFYQGHSLEQALGFMVSGYVSTTGIEIVDTLLSDGGINSMLETVALFIFTLGLGGILSGSGILPTVLEPLFAKLNSVKKLINATLGITFINCMIGASATFAYAVTGPAMSPIYNRLNLDRVNLSRTMEDAGAVSGVIIPWHITAVFAASVLGVSQFEFIPFLFLSFLSPLVASIYAWTGFAIKEARPEDVG